MAWKLGCCKKIHGLGTTSLLLLILMAGTPFSAPTKDSITSYDKKIRTKKNVLDSIKTAITNGRNKIKNLSRQEGNYLSQLKQFEKNIENSEKYLEEITVTIDTINAHMLLLEDTLAFMKIDLDKRMERIKKRLRTIYKTGKPDFWEIILTSSNISDILRKIHYFQVLNEYDKKLIEGIKESKIEVEKREIQLSLRQQELYALKDDKEEEQVMLLEEKKEKEKILNSVISEKKSYTEMVNELENAQHELNMIIKQLRAKKRNAKIEYERNLKIAFKKRKGSLPWPVDGKIIKHFGKIVHPVYKTVTMNNGIDIKAPKGSYVHAVAPGQVDYIGWMRGYGKFVIVNHFGGYITIYAHLDKITVKENQNVEYRTVLGTVGETGSLNGIELHFQIRKYATSEDPELWLEKKEL